ncbi:MAG: LysR family transcriptional regulator [Novosphingobium sp.]|nr:LysR family transcriptional regulator [Novosphingobium sp.]
MFDFTIRQLEILLKVEETGSFRKAADALGVSEAAVSDHVRTLERQLGSELFARRRGTSASLRECAREFHSDVKAFVEQGRRISNGFRRRSGQQSTIRMHVGEHLLQDYLRPALPEFLANNRDIHFDFIPIKSRSAVLSALAAGEIDGAVISVANAEEFPDSTLISTIGSGLYANADLARQARISGLGSLPFLGASYDTGTPQTDEQGLATFGIDSPVIARRYPYHDVGVKLAIQGFGAVLMMDSIVEVFDENSELEKIAAGRLFERRYRLADCLPVERKAMVEGFLERVLGAR